MLVLVAAVGVRAQSPAPASVKDGVYTKAQAERGQKVFDQTCKGCHALVPGEKVANEAPGPDLAGEEFLTHWAGKPASAVAKIIFNTMPNDFSMEMTEPISLDLTAYILQVNKFPDGAAELTADTAKTAMIVK